jgi:hypothetical protein
VEAGPLAHHHVSGSSSAFVGGNFFDALAKTHHRIYVGILLAAHFFLSGHGFHFGQSLGGHLWWPEAFSITRISSLSASRTCALTNSQAMPPPKIAIST